jgi:CMP-N-acetylneuraminic acid synthetase
MKRPDDIAVFLNVRLRSRRCPGKMLRPFAGSTLIDICLKKVSALRWDKTYFGAYEEELLERAKDYPGLTVYRRSMRSAQSDSDPREIFEILEVIDAPYVLWVNPCAPLLGVETLRAALQRFMEIGSPALTSVKQVFGWFYSRDGRPLNNMAGNVDTAQSEPVLQVAHAFHIYARRRMLETGRPWTNAPGDPDLFPIPDAEAHDIDTEEDFETVECLYRIRRQGGGPHA